MGSADPQPVTNCFGHPVRIVRDTAREAGASWAQLGDQWGITRQSAHERWAKLIDPAGAVSPPGAVVLRRWTLRLPSPNAGGDRGMQ